MTRMLLVLVLALEAMAQEGKTLYDARCGGCHNAPSGRVPTFSALQHMPPATIRQALETGKMKAQAAGLSNADISALVSYLAVPGSVPDAPAKDAAGCATSGHAEQGSAGWLQWGANERNTRFQSAAGLTAADIPKLKLKWAFALGEGASVRSQPAVANGTIFSAGLTNQLYALDAQTGCTKWTFAAEGKIRTGLVLDAQTVYFGDEKANAYAVDAADGKLRWKMHAGEHFAAVLTGAPLLHGGVLYVPVASYEELMAASPGYECCTFRGEVVALDAATGKCLWKAFTIPVPAASAGKTHGPSGAAVWSTPTFDEKLNAVYVATGDNYSEPASTTSDSVLAFDAKTGTMLWSKQLTASDVFNMGPHSKGSDFDFGQPPILTALAGGKRALLIGQKSGMAYALDPDRQGDVLWQTKLGHGGALGGIQWGSATDGERMYVAVSDIALQPVADKAVPGGYRMEVDSKTGGGLFALDPATGKKLWNAAPASCGDKKNCSPAQSAAVSAVPGAVLSGSVDGHLRAYAAGTGEVIWDIDTAREYNTVNGKARGGSLDVAGPVIAGGMVFVNSGYGQWGGMPGNVLLAFSVDGK